MGPHQHHEIRAERLIAGGRLALAALSLVALELAPSARPASAGSAEVLVAAYLVWALAVVGVAWRWGDRLLRFRVALHALDLAVACGVMGLTDGSRSPLFLLWVFALVAAALRWPWAGTLWTAAIALAAFLGLGVFTAMVRGRADVDVDPLVLRGGSLVVVAVLLGFLGAFGHRLRAANAGLAAWARGAPQPPERQLSRLLERSAELLAAPRLLLLWEEPEEPWLRLASWSPQGFEAWREAPGTFDPPVAEPLSGVTFLCPDAAAAAPVVRLAAAGLTRWRGEPLHAGLRARFEIRSVLALALGGADVSGWLFALDKPRLSVDDLALGESVGRRVEADLEQLYLVERLQEAAATEERVRLARDLHDGVIQSLGSAALRLETARRLLAEDPAAAAQVLAETQDLLVAEQQDLRGFIRDPGLPRRDPRGRGGELRQRLEASRQRVERYWGLTVDLTADLADGAVSPALAHEVDRIVHEALVNAAKHGKATRAKVAVGVEEDAVRIAVEDDGHGFPFRGDYDFAALRAGKLGPVTLKQRIAAAGGSLCISSHAAGARLAIELPLR
jgi:signal transduction histidine kinase